MAGPGAAFLEVRRLFEQAHAALGEAETLAAAVLAASWAECQHAAVQACMGAPSGLALVGARGQEPQHRSPLGGHPRRCGRGRGRGSARSGGLPASLEREAAARAPSAARRAAARAGEGADAARGPGCSVRLAGGGRVEPAAAAVDSEGARPAAGATSASESTNEGGSPTTEDSPLLPPSESVGTPGSGGSQEGERAASAGSGEEEARAAAAEGLREDFHGGRLHEAQAAGTPGSGGSQEGERAASAGSGEEARAAVAEGLREDFHGGRLHEAQAAGTPGSGGSQEDERAASAGSGEEACAAVAEGLPEDFPGGRLHEDSPLLPPTEAVGTPGSGGSQEGERAASAGSGEEACAAASEGLREDFHLGRLHEVQAVCTPVSGGPQEGERAVSAGSSEEACAAASEGLPEDFPGGRLQEVQATAADWICLPADDEDDDEGPTSPAALQDDATAGARDAEPTPGSAPRHPQTPAPPPAEQLPASSVGAATVGEVERAADDSQAPASAAGEAPEEAGGAGGAGGGAAAAPETEAAGGEPRTGAGEGGEVVGSDEADAPNSERPAGPAFEDVWEVVGGCRTGVHVRVGPGLHEQEAVHVDSSGSTSRLAIGALVRQLALVGSRLQYELLVGKGPFTGWVTTSAAGKELVRKLDGPPEARSGPWSQPARIPPSPPQMPFAPRILWTYWDQGFQALPAFHKLCIETWRRTHPQWRIEVVDCRSIYDFVPPEELPPTFGRLERFQHRADCARSALLCRHGGVYMDPTILAWRDVPEVVGFNDIERGVRDYVGYFRESASLGMVENWFMACRRGCEFIRRWHETHLEYWGSQESVGKPFHADPFFQGVDFSCFAEDEMDYLAQHACLAKLMQSDPEFGRMAEARAELHDCRAPKFGGLWLNRKLRHRAAHRASIRCRSATGVQLRTSLRSMHSSARESWPPAGHSYCREMLHVEETEEALVEDVLWREDRRLLDEVEALDVPFAKFTGPVTERLKRLRRLDLLQWPSLLRSLFRLSLGQEVELPMPPGGRPPRLKGQLV